MGDEAVSQILARHADKVLVDEEQSEDILEHYGVKGQKWGVRRYQKTGRALVRAKNINERAAAKGGVTSGFRANRAKAAEKRLDKINKRIVKKGGAPVSPNRPVGVKNKAGKTKFEKKPHRLSEEELQSRIRRMELEKRYSDLNAKQVSKGRKFTSDVMNKAGMSVATTLLSSAALLVVGHAISKKFGPEVGKTISTKDIPSLQNVSSGINTVRKINPNPGSFL